MICLSYKIKNKIFFKKMEKNGKKWKKKKKLNSV